MALTSTFSTIAATQTAADKPLDTTLMDAVRQDIDVIYEWMGGPTYTPSTSHNHNGVNSASVSLGSSSITTTMLADLAVTEAKLAASAVSQGKLKTALQQQSANPGANRVDIAATGGTYTLTRSLDVGGGDVSLLAAATGSYTVTMGHNNTGTVYYYQSRYIQASPPDNLGDGEFTGFVFIEMRPNGTIAAVDMADDSPWIYNGPNKLDPYTQFHNASGVRYRRVRQIIAEFGGVSAALASGLTRAQIMDRLVTDSLVDEEITYAVKNRDMAFRPHPFTKPAVGNTIVMLDPFSQFFRQLRRLHHLVDPDFNATKMLMDGLITVGNTALVRVGPPGVMVVSASLK